jgi:hypothetical protein
VEIDFDALERLNRLILEVCRKAGIRDFDLGELAKLCLKSIYLKEELFEEILGNVSELENEADIELVRYKQAGGKKHEELEFMEEEEIGVRKSSTPPVMFSRNGLEEERRIKKPPDPGGVVGDMMRSIVRETDVYASKCDIVENGLSIGDEDGLDLNCWGSLGRRKSFKKMKKKKISLSGLCFKNFRWKKGSNTWVVVDDYAPVTKEMLILDAGKKKKRKKKFVEVDSIAKGFIGVLKRDFSRSAFPEGCSGNRELSFKGKNAKLICRRNEAKKMDNSVLTVKQTIKLLVVFWKKLQVLKEVVIDGIGKILPLSSACLDKETKTGTPDIKQSVPKNTLSSSD